MNTKYFITREDNYQNYSSNLFNDKTYSTFATNEGSQYYNNRTNDNKYYLNNIGLSNNSLSNFRKINNLYEDNYNQKYINTNYKNDISRNGIIRDDNIRNATLNKLTNFQNTRPYQKLSTTNHNYNNTLYNRTNNEFRPINKKVFTERSHNKDYNFSINGVRMNNRQERQEIYISNKDRKSVV